MDTYPAPEAQLEQNFRGCYKAPLPSLQAEQGKADSEG